MENETTVNDLSTILLDAMMNCDEEYYSTKDALQRIKAHIEQAALKQCNLPLWKLEGDTRANDLHVQLYYSTLSNMTAQVLTHAALKLSHYKALPVQ